MNVTLFPAQMLDPALLAMDTDAATEGVTVIVILLLVAVVPAMQERLLVTIQVTSSLLVSVLVV